MSDQPESPRFRPPLAEATRPPENQTENYTVQILEASIPESELLQIIEGIQTVYYLNSLPHTVQEYTTKKGKQVKALRHTLTKNAPDKYPWAVKKGFLFGNTSPEDLEEGIRRSLTPDGHRKYIVVRDHTGEIVGFNKLEITAIHPAFRTVPDRASNFRPSELLVAARENYARQAGLPDIFSWVVSSHLENTASLKFQKHHGYRPVCTVPSFSVYATATGFYKHLN